MKLLISKIGIFFLMIPMIIVGPLVVIGEYTEKWCMALVHKLHDWQKALVKWGSK